MTNKKNIVIGLVSIIVLATIMFFVSGNKAKAQANSTADVKFYGSIDTAVQKFDNGSTEVTRVNDGGVRTSRLGVRGSSADLGGLKLGFNLEGGLKTNAATMGSTSSTGQVFAREAWLSAKGEPGEVRLGTQDLTQAGDMDTLAFTFGNQTNFPVNGTAIELGGDANNSIRYISPTIGGFTLEAGTTTNSSSATTAANDTVKAGSLIYKVGPASIGAGYAFKKAPTAAAELDSKAIGATYDFGTFSVGAAYLYGDNSTTTTVKSTASIISARVPFANGVAAHALYATAKDGAQTTANEGTGYTVGLTKTFAPGAFVYTAYSKVDNEDNSTMYLHGMTKPSAGKNPSLMTVGVNYSF